LSSSPIYPPTIPKLGGGYTKGIGYSLCVYFKGFALSGSEIFLKLKI